MKRDCLHSPRNLSLKVAFRRLVEACGGVEAAAVLTRCSAAQLSNYQNPNTDLFPPADVIADLEEVSARLPGWPAMTRQLARLSGHVLVRMPDELGSPNEVMERVASILGAAGPLGEKTMLALRDGKLSAEEKRGLAVHATVMAEEATALAFVLEAG